MAFSVLMSLYYKENPQYLTQSLESVFHQTLMPDEVVLMIDGPITPELEEVVMNFCDNHQELTVVPHEMHQGLGKVLNEGVMICQHPLIARMDTDDICEPNRFEKQVEYLNSHPEIDVLGGAIQEFSDDKGDLRIRFYPFTPEAVVRNIHKGSPLAHPSVMMRKKIFENGLEYGTKYGPNEDISLWFDVVNSGYKIANIEDVILRFRRNDNVYKRRSNEKAIGEFKAFCHGIRSLYGILSLKYLYPLARLIFRYMPKSFVKAVYNSPLRIFILENHKK